MGARLIIEDWVLYDYTSVNFVSTDAYTGQEFIDTKQEAKSLRVIGTKEQIKKARKLYNIDEVYTYHKFIRDSQAAEYWRGICWSDEVGSTKPTLNQYNEKYEKDYKSYLRMYRNNDNEILKLRTR